VIEWKPEEPLTPDKTDLSRIVAAQKELLADKEELIAEKDEIIAACIRRSEEGTALLRADLKEAETRLGIWEIYPRYLAIQYCALCGGDNQHINHICIRCKTKNPPIHCSP
jgi:hypothetical protein